MRKQPIYTFLFMCFLSFNLSVAKDRDPIVVSPLIGDKLDRVERNYFSLFPHFDGFEEAVFYLNPDSSLAVEIKYQTDEGVKDTTIERYRSISNLQYHIDQIFKNPPSPSNQARKGSYTTITTLDSSIVSGELIETGKFHLQVYNSDYIIPGSYDLGSAGYKKINFSDIQEIKCITTTNFAPLIFGAAGGLTGFIIGLQKGQGSPYQVVGVMLYGLIGLGIGTLMSLIIPIEIESENNFNPPFDENDIKGLRDKTKVY